MEREIPVSLRVPVLQAFHTWSDDLTEHEPRNRASRVAERLVYVALCDAVPDAKMIRFRHAPSGMVVCSSGVVRAAVCITLAKRASGRAA